MDLVEITPDDVVGVDAFVAVSRACDEVDASWWKPLTRYRQQMRMTYGWDGEVARYFLAVLDGVTVGNLILHTSEYDNRDQAGFELKVHPDLRRQGHGSAILDAATTEAKAMGRTLMLLDAWEGDAPSGFAKAHAIPVRSIAVLRVQELTGTDEERAGFAAMRDEAAAASAGYDVVRIEGRTPPELLADLVTATLAINDAPMDDLEFEDEAYDVDRVQAYEEAQLASGHRFRRVIAVERATGAIAGHSVITVDTEQPTYGEQHDTSVLPDHRGHRLGLRIKAEMLCWLAETEPQLTWVETENMESNDHMIAVNERLGFRPFGRFLLFQRHFEAQDVHASLE